ncbi:MAG: ABC transporter ATP-binding protein [Chloroflexi bacterium]|nr:ABC transporter ATP-binding protein [Chloroflexota bacterium]MDA1173754.1 ABC transporter ATP-binding protein [Chloroflexota bacterium]
MSSPAILLHGVTKHFGSVQALRGVDFDVQRGEVFGFLGPNGAGKTTAIRVLTGFISLDAGTAQVLGFDVGRESVEIKRHLGFLPDTISFGRGLTGEAFLNHIGRLHGFRGAPPMQRELLDRLELSSSALKRGVKGYPTGMGKKLALVQAMQHDPELLILDEPTESLDPLVRQTLFELFRDLQKRGTTIFMSSHVLADVEEICERVALIREGRVVRFGPEDDLRVGRVRTMKVTLREATDAFAVEGGRVVERDDRVVRLAVEGDINDVIRGLAGYDIEDVLYERMSLEELFLGYYRGDEGEASADAPEGQHG